MVVVVVVVVVVELLRLLSVCWATNGSLPATALAASAPPTISATKATPLHSFCLMSDPLSTAPLGLAEGCRVETSCRDVLAG